MHPGLDQTDQTEETSVPASFPGCIGYFKALWEMTEVERCMLMGSRVIGGLGPWYQSQTDTAGRSIPRGVISFRTASELRPNKPPPPPTPLSPSSSLPHLVKSPELFDL